MSSDKKSNLVSVKFAYYMPYEHFPETIFLANIAPSDADKLLTAINTSQSNEKSCIQTMHAQLTQTRNAHFGRKFFTDAIDKNELLLTNMFYFENSPMLCYTNKKRAPKSEPAMTTACARCLKSGKCCDDLIRRILGETLFPNLYNKTK